MGVHKSKERLHLEKFDIHALLKVNTPNELALFFNVSNTTFSRAAYSQLKETEYKKRENEFRSIEINLFEESNKKVEFSGTKGAWKELKETPLYKQIMYGRN